MNKSRYIRSVVVAVIGIVVGIVFFIWYSVTFTLDAGDLNAQRLPAFLRNTPWVRVSNIGSVTNLGGPVGGVAGDEDKPAWLISAPNSPNDCGILYVSADTKSVSPEDVTGRLKLVKVRWIVKDPESGQDRTVRYTINMTGSRFVSRTWMGVFVALWGVFQLYIVSKLYRKLNRMDTTPPAPDASGPTDTPPETEPLASTPSDQSL